MIGIVDYRAGNLTSVARALESLHEPCIVTDDAKMLDDASRIIFPGVGAAGAAMANLRESGLDGHLQKWVRGGKPVLGICLGTQVIFDRSEEDDTPCLGIVPGVVKRFPADLREGEKRLKIPHMGWNRVAFRKDHPVFAGIPGDAEFYFVHSYYPAPTEETWVAGWTDYGIRFCSVVARGNLVAVQFHPEKSGRPGIALLANFCRWGESMLSKRIIPCLDVRDGRLTKGIKFKGNVDIGDPVEAARAYYEQGADEIVFYDITASAERRAIMLDVVKRVAETIFIPFSVGGGIGTVEEMRQVILAGAEKVSVNSAAVKHPDIIAAGAKAFGSQCIVLGMDVRKVPATPEIPSGYEMVIHGGRTATGLDALRWAQEAERLGAGEICLNSIDADGTLDGYELDLTALVSSHVGIPVIASGGAGKPEHLLDVLTRGKADAALIASMVHYRTHTIPGIKNFLHDHGVKTRLQW